MVIELAAGLAIDCLEADLAPEDAASADEIFMTATSIGILHVRSFELKQLGNGRIGPVTARLRSSLSQAMGVDFATQAARYAEMRASAAPGEGNPGRKARGQP